MEFISYSEVLVSFVIIIFCIVCTALVRLVDICRDQTCAKTAIDPNQIKILTKIITRFRILICGFDQIFLLVNFVFFI
ncbi:MAG: hypothetical protein WCG25_06770 [bacterium]